jgi:arylsulfatase A-like enzyme
LWGHDFNGIFIAWGKDFKNTTIDREVSLYDIAPTVLALFGIKPPRYMDGKPLVAVNYEIEVDESRIIKSTIKKLRFEKKI